MAKESLRVLGKIAEMNFISGIDVRILINFVYP